jgi:hypothetical protein
MLAMERLPLQPYLSHLTKKFCEMALLAIPAGPPFCEEPSTADHHVAGPIPGT